MKVALTGGAYQALSVIASAQRSLNLFAEPMPQAQGEPAPVAHYPTPGLLNTLTLGSGPIRGILLVPDYIFYVVSGSDVWRCEYTGGPPLAPTFSTTALGSITPGLTTPVSMADNGLALVIVDGHYDPTFVDPTAWTIDLATDAFSVIPNGGFFPGADKVDYLDGYFIFNQPFSQNFWISQFMLPSFDPLGLDFAAKITHSDLLRTLIVSKRLVYLFGDRMTEIWYNAGATDIGAGSFPFAEMQSEVIIDHGVLAKYTPADYDNSVFWLTISRAGHPIVMQATGYQTKRVSTYAIENHFSKIEQTDAIGFVVQYLGHAMYVLTFPTADETWAYDITTGHWHEWRWMDADGNEHRHRAMSYCSVGGIPTVGDWENGKLYALDGYTDDGQPIKRQRSFQHLLADGRRVFYREFVADMEAGNAPSPLAASPRAAWPSGFTTLPFPSGGLNGAAYSLSADGNTAVGFVNPTGDDSTPRRACYWTPSSGPVLIAPNGSEADLVSPDGSLIIGSSGPPFRWTASGGLVPFGVSGDGVFAMSADTTRIVGSTSSASPYEQACYWNSGGTMTLLGFLSGHNSSRAMGVSGDGSVIVGYSMAVGMSGDTERAWRWTAAGGMIDLGLVGTATGARAFGVSNDGTIVVGGANGSGGGAFRWTVATGMVLVPDMVIATGISGDGSTIMGSCFYAADPADFDSSYLGYNTAAGGTIVPVPNFPAGTYPQGINATGTIFAGFSYGSITYPWVYSLSAPPPCVLYLDWSNDRGHTFGTPVGNDMNSQGYLTSLQWQRLGMARDRVFRLTWTCADKTALQGAWVTAITGDEDNEMAGQGGR